MFAMRMHVVVIAVIKQKLEIRTNALELCRKFMPISISTRHHMLEVRINTNVRMRPHEH
jgi:hypothetical protein